MNKGLYRALFSLLLACFCLAEAALPAYAAPARVKFVTTRAQVTTSVHRRRGTRALRPYSSRGWHPYHSGAGSSEINQYFHGNTDFNHFKYVVGTSREENSGNVGYNRGHNQDNSTNGGNQMLLSGRPIRYRRVNQYYYGNSHFNRRGYRFNGYDEINSGNDGTNRGVNQDNSTNGGNQIIG